MGYIDEALTNDEHVIFTGKVSRKSFITNYLLGLFFLLISLGSFSGESFSGTKEYSAAFFFLFLGIYPFIYAAISIKTTEIGLTNKRFIAKYGVISRKTIEIGIKKIESIQVNQSLFGRALNFGSIIISGAGNPQGVVKNISAPMKFKRMLQEYLDKIESE